LACPTDTVYGLICDAKNKKAISRIFLIKKRPKNKPLPVFVRNIAMAKTLAKIDKHQEKFLKKVWPGAVTVILKSKNKNSTIGLRIPSHKFVLGLAKHIGPLTETSANISGKLPAGNVKEILKHPVKKVDYVELDPMIIKMAKEYLPAQEYRPHQDRHGRGLLCPRHCDGHPFCQRCPFRD